MEQILNFVINILVGIVVAYFTFVLTKSRNKDNKLQDMCDDMIEMKSDVKHIINGLEKQDVKNEQIYINKENIIVLTSRIEKLETINKLENNL